ncbi:MAG: hypothetical protein J6N21_04425 [Butyrivibrio sp.]|nr:hypothetical protein [Butyrivibrio sp.]
MLSVMLIWLYVIATTYLIGYACTNMLTALECMHLHKAKGSKKYSVHFHESYIIVGLVVNTVYAQIFSLLAGVGLWANLIMLVICVIIAVYYRDELFESGIDLLRMLLANRNWLYYTLIFLFMAYGTSHGIMHYDSDLYHAQAIHWIEDYGVVKGLGNLHIRLAYNSSSFALSALYSMRFLTGRSFHVMAGFFALLLAWQCLDLKNILRRGHPVISDFARIMAIYYLFTIYDEMVAPASDYFLSTIVFYVIIHWLDMNVRHERSYVPYIMLALVGVYAVTIKLSAAPMLLLSIIPICKLLHEKNRHKLKALLISVLMAFIIVIPFFIRNILISGWLLYPVTSLDFFNFAWEIPKGLAAYDAMEIKTYGRGYTDVAAYNDVPFTEWIVKWFDGISGFNKIMLILDMAAVFVYIACLIYFLVVVIGRKSKYNEKLSNSKVFNINHRSMLRFADFLTISGTMILCLCFWLFSAPLIRYGEVYVCLTFTIVFGRLLILIFHRFEHDNKIVVRCLQLFCCLMVIWMGYKVVRLGMYDIPRFNISNLLVQQDYGEYEVDTYKLDGITFYYPVEDDRVGYYPFPSTPKDMTGKMQLMGSKIENGIMPIDE